MKEISLEQVKLDLRWSDASNELIRKGLNQAEEGKSLRLIQTSFQYITRKLYQRLGWLVWKVYRRPVKRTGAEREKREHRG